MSSLTEDRLRILSDAPSSSNEQSVVFGDDVRSQLDLLILLVALIGAGVTLGSLASPFAGLVCAGIAAITFGRLYDREFR